MTCPICRVFVFLSVDETSTPAATSVGRAQLPLSITRARLNLTDLSRRKYKERLNINMKFKRSFYLRPERGPAPFDDFSELILLTTRRVRTNAERCVYGKRSRRFISPQRRHFRSCFFVCPPLVSERASFLKVIPRGGGVRHLDYTYSSLRVLLYIPGELLHWYICRLSPFNYPVNIPTSMYGLSLTCRLCDCVTRT